MNVPLVDLLYDLKRDWGQAIVYRVITEAKADPETGQVGEGEQKCNVARAVIFPVEVARTFIRAWRAGKYPYDSNYDEGSHMSLIQKTDLPLGIIPSSADTIETMDKRNYEVKAVNDLHEAWELTLVELPT